MPDDRKYDDKKPTPTQVRINWARGMHNDDICDFLQGKLLEARADRGTHVGLLNELVHEIKHRLRVTKYNTNGGDEYYEEGSEED